MKTKKRNYRKSLLLVMALYLNCIAMGETASRIMLVVNGKNIPIEQSEINKITNDAINRLKQNNPGDFKSAQNAKQNIEKYCQIAQEEIILWNTIKEYSKNIHINGFKNGAEALLRETLNSSVPPISWIEFEKLLSTTGRTPKMELLKAELGYALATDNLITNPYNNSNPITETELNYYCQQNKDVLESLSSEDGRDILELFKQEESLQVLLDRIHCTKGVNINIRYNSNNSADISNKSKNNETTHSGYLYRRIKAFHETGGVPTTVISIGKKIIDRYPKSSNAYYETCVILKEVFQDEPELAGEYGGQEFISYLEGEIKEWNKRNTLVQKIDEIETLRFRKNVRKIIAKEEKSKILASLQTLTRKPIVAPEVTIAKKVPTASSSSRSSSRYKRFGVTPSRRTSRRRAVARSKAIRGRSGRGGGSTTFSSVPKISRKVRGNCPACYGIGKKDLREYTTSEWYQVEAMMAQGGNGTYSIPCSVCNGTGNY